MWFKSLYKMVYVFLFEFWEEQYYASLAKEEVLPLRCH